MDNVTPTNNGVRAWTRENFPGQGKALGHTKNKFKELVNTDNVDNNQSPNPVKEIDEPQIPVDTVNNIDNINEADQGSIVDVKV